MSYDVVVKTTVKVGSAEIETIAERTFTGITKELRQQFDLNNSTETLWDASVAGAHPSFTIMVIKSDQPVELELTVKEGDANEELISVTLAKNTAFVLGDDAARYNHSASDSFAGTLDVIDKLRCKELNSVAATVELRLYS